MVKQSNSSSSFFSTVHGIIIMGELVFQYQAWYPYCWVGFKSNLTSVGDSQHVNVTPCIFYVYLAVLLIVVVHKCYILVELFMCFVPLAACTVFSGRMDARL